MNVPDFFKIFRYMIACDFSKISLGSNTESAKLHVQVFRAGIIAEVLFYRKSLIYLSRNRALMLLSQNH